MLLLFLESPDLVALLELDLLEGIQHLEVPHDLDVLSLQIEAALGYYDDPLVRESVELAIHEPYQSVHVLPPVPLDFPENGYPEIDSHD